MNDSRFMRGVRELLNGERGVSPVIAVALLILIAIGFAVAIQGVGSDLITSVQEPPEATIDADPDEEEIRFTVEDVQNADQLIINHEGSEITPSDGILYPTAGNSTVVNYASDINGPDAETGDQINIVAVDFPDNRRVVYTYTIPDNAVVT